MAGFDVMDAGLISAMMVALAAGVLSFLSPCVLPIVPPYLAYMGGISMSDMKGQGRRAILLPALFFVLGLSTVFLFLGLAASALGTALLQYRDVMTTVSGLVVILFGLHFLGLFRIGLLNRDMRVDAGDKGGSAFGAYVLGLAFAFGWTPCIGPQLGAILSLAANEADMARGTALLGVYAAGLGLPFLIAALFINRAIGVMNRLKPWMGVIEKAMGALLIVVGLALVTGLFSAFSFFLLENVPLLGRLG